MKKRRTRLGQKLFPADKRRESGVAGGGPDHPGWGGGGGKITFLASNMGNSPCGAPHPSTHVLNQLLPRTSDGMSHGGTD